MRLTNGKCAIAVLAVFLAVLLGWSPGRAQAEPRPLALKRGVSIHGWLNWSPLTAPGAYKWPPFRPLGDWGGLRDFERIKAMGFDFVRLSVDPGPLLAADGSQLDQALAVLENDVRIVSGTGLKVLLDLHPVSQVKAWSAEAIEVSPTVANRYRAVVAATAAMLARAGSDRVAFELMNEPQFYPCDGDGGREWEARLIALVRAARARAPDLTLVVSGACGGNVTGLTQLSPAKLGDDRLLYSFHFYEPLPFTHQGTPNAKDVRGAPWPVERSALARSLADSDALIQADKSLTSPGARAAELANVKTYLQDYASGKWNEDLLEARFEQVRTWAVKNGVPTSRLLLGEFGVTAAEDGHGGALDSDRFLWLDAVRRAAEGLGASWCYWEYSNPYGMSLTTPDQSRSPDPVAMTALNLTTPSADMVGN
jgi:endoglucanase